MAYVNFSEVEGGLPIPSAGAGPSETSSRDASAGFSGLEWSVIAVARADRLTSLRQPSRMAVALGNLFGTWQNARLADGRLEALRRMAVFAWHKSYVVPVAELRAFFAAGFSTEQYETLLRSVTAERARAGKQRA